LNPDVSPYLCLEEYLEKTKHLRQSDNLLVATIKPHRAIGSQTLHRWIKIVLAGASIDITLFKPHSTRHAAATAGHVADLPVDEIPKRAGWSNATTFRRFYYKGVIE
jgi:integrase